MRCARLVWGRPAGSSLHPKTTRQKSQKSHCRTPTQIFGPQLRSPARHATRARHHSLPGRLPPRGRQAARVGEVHSTPNPVVVAFRGGAAHKPRRPAHIGSPALFPSTPCLAGQTSQSAWTTHATRTPGCARRRCSLRPTSRCRRVQRGSSPQTAPPPPDIPCARPLLAGRYDRARQIMSTPRLVPELPELASRSRWAH